MFVVPASFVVGLVFFSPSIGEEVARPGKGTPLDAFSIMLANMVKVSATLFRILGSFSDLDIRLETMEVKVSYFVVIFKGSSLRLFGMELAKSCEAKSLDNSGVKEVTRSSVS
ncbi:hypothetical protein Tco_1285745 [Tanacetum coccineum]